MPARSSALSSEQGTAAGATPPGSSPAGKAPPREGMPRRPGIDQSSRNDFCPIPSRESRHSRLPRRRPPSAVPCVPEGSPPYEPAFLPGARGRAAASILINIHQCSSFALLPVESRAAPPLQRHVRRRGPRAASGLSGTGHAVYRSAFSRVPCSVKIFASCCDRSGPFLALTWTQGTYMIVY